MGACHHLLRCGGRAPGYGPEALSVGVIVTRADDQARGLARGQPGHHGQVGVHGLVPDLLAPNPDRPVAVQADRHLLRGAVGHRRPW